MHKKALALAKELNLEAGILKAEGAVAVALMISGNYPLGLDYAFKTLSLAKRINRKYSSAKALTSVGSFFPVLLRECCSMPFTIASARLP